MDFKICVVGCGGIANNVHGPSYSRYAALKENTVLAACCDLDEGKAKAFKDKFGFKRHYTDMLGMLDTEKPDAVCLISPAHLTAALAVKIMERGYPLIMEKPPGVTPEETLKILAQAQKTHSPNQVAFNRRYMPIVEELTGMLEKELRGSSIQNIKLDMLRVGRNDRDFAETAIHGIDTAKFIAKSDYSHISFHYQEMPGFGENVANIFMDCIFNSGTTAQMSFCPMAGITVERISVNAFNHTFFAELPVWDSVDSPGRVIHYIENKKVAEVSGKAISGADELFITNGFYKENEVFFDDLRKGILPSCDVFSALQSVEIADCIRTRKQAYCRK